jgi:MFS superfamily sulfate permease-like transporter
MNIFSSLFGGILMCHGAGGLAAHYRFGARTVAAPVITGSILVSFGIFYGRTLSALLDQFPLPILGVILLFSALELALKIRDVTRREELFIVILTGALCAFVPYGFLIGWPTGILLTRIVNRKTCVYVPSIT